MFARRRVDQSPIDIVEVLHKVLDNTMDTISGKARFTYQYMNQAVLTTGELNAFKRFLTAHQIRYKDTPSEQVGMQEYESNFRFEISKDELIDVFQEHIPNNQHAPIS